MTSQLVLAVIFFLILLTFKSPPPQFLTGSINYFTSRDFQVSVPFISAIKKERQKVFEVEPIEAKGVLVLDLSQNKILFEKNASEVLPLASLTKLMTALLLEEGAQDNSLIPISEKAFLQAGGEGMIVGEEYHKEDLLDIILAASSNDGAWAAAEYLSPNAENFYELMNERAKKLNLSSLNYLNPHGLDLIQNTSRSPGAFGNSKDVAFLMEYIYKNHPRLLEKTREEQFSVITDGGRSILFQNTNQAIKDIPQIIGGKTGYTISAGGNLVFIFDAGFNHPIIVSILGSSEIGRFEDAKKLADAVLKYYQNDKSND